MDNPDKTRATLDRQRNDYNKTEVAKVLLAHLPGDQNRFTKLLVEVYSAPPSLLTPQPKRASGKPLASIRH